MTHRTAEDVRATFLKEGTSITEWARAHNVHPSTVYEVLAGRKLGLRGDAHKVMVLLGMKEGSLPEEKKTPEEEKIP